MVIKKELIRFTYHITVTLFFISLFFFIAKELFPDGINKNLSLRAWKIFLLLSIVGFSALLLSSKFRINTIALDVFPVSQQGKLFNQSAVFAAFLPLTPIIQYLILNFEELGWVGALYFAFLFVVVLVIFLALIPYLLSSLVDRDMMISTFTSMLFCFFYMATLANDFNWHLLGSLKLQLFVFLILSISIYFILKLNKTFLSAMVMFYFLLNTTILLNNTLFSSSEIQYKNSKVFSLAGKSTATIKPDIYILTYDAYVNNETMMGYGIDNSEQENYLKNTGFKLYPNTYSLAADTIATMSRVLDWDGISYPNGTNATKPDGLSNGKPRNGVSGNGVVNKIFKKIGYETYGSFKSEYFFTGVGSFWDYTYPKIISPESTQVNLAKSLALSVFEGEFRFDAEFEGFKEKDFLQNKKNTLRNKTGIPRFVYTHTGPGHTASVCQKDDIFNFENRLYKSNIEMKQDINNILENKPNSIIIINGDHGPYITKNCFILNDSEYAENDITRLDIQDRLGTFLAIKWPENFQQSTDEIVTLQDVFPMILSKMFNEPLFISPEYRADTQSIVSHTAGVGVNNGIIIGGINGGEKLFLNN